MRDRIGEVAAATDTAVDGLTAAVQTAADVMQDCEWCEVLEIDVALTLLEAALGLAQHVQGRLREVRAATNPDTAA